MKRLRNNREDVVIVVSALVVMVASTFGRPQVAGAEPAGQRKPRILYVIATGGYHHSSCEFSAGVMLGLSRESGLFDVVCANTTELISRDSLKQFDAVFFSNTTGDLEQSRFPIDQEGREALIDFVKEGGAFLGAHAATDTLKDWAPYYEMIGGSFKGHPWNETVTIEVEDPIHPAAQPLPSPWTIKDEIYIFRNFSRDNVHVILRLKEAPKKDGHDPSVADYPLSWCKSYGKGRVFYTAMGHGEDVWANEIFQKHLLGGIRWAFQMYSNKPELEPLANDKPQLDPELSIGHAVIKSEWAPIFDGKNLEFGTDWVVSEDPSVNRKHWTVQPGGILQGTGQGSSHLYYIKKPFRNFEYRADVNIDPDGNSGMYFRCPKEGNLLDSGQWRNWPRGYEAQVNNGYKGDPKRSGTFYPEPTLLSEDIKKLLGYEKSKDDGDVWFKQHVIAVGDLFVIKLNDRVAVVHRDQDANDDKNFDAGFFAFQTHHPNSRVRFKNIEVRELP